MGGDLGEWGVRFQIKKGGGGRIFYVLVKGVSRVQKKEKRSLAGVGGGGVLTET